MDQKTDKNTKIRKFSEKDLIQINKIENLVFDQEPYSPYTFLQYNNPKTAFYVAEKNNQIIGYVIIKTMFPKNAKLISIAVHPDHQSQGIGTKLIKKAINKTKDLGARKINLEVRKTNKKAIKFYRKLGFKKTKIKKNYYRDGENAVYMKKTNKKHP